MRNRRYIPASAVERDVLASLQAEANRTHRPLSSIVAEALDRYVVATDHLRAGASPTSR